MLPIHSINIDQALSTLRAPGRRGFWIGQTEVTQRAWAKTQGQESEQIQRRGSARGDREVGGGRLVLHVDRNEDASRHSTHLILKSFCDPRNRLEYPR